MKVHFFEDNQDQPLVLDVLRQLRPQYDRAALLAQITRQMAQGYQVVYVKSGDQVMGVAGFVVSDKLAWGKAIYIDDLVTAEQHRSKGVGECLIDWFKVYAKEQGCQQLHLDSGVQRFAAHKFYLREGFHIASHHFSMTEIK
ncbi:GNAT family N-acetyltransferase [Photobacterium sp. 2_MG-2023]|uniref:GNAT family N-acetyltransferase n=1 Tax=Photobacterium sp. 2_MG-2023 TaxID=3062663 RepID=UPI0026E44AF5|nr:GNAT family N-acetyltransferase [Photobacterium sp. 2_MG-2023]MDO6583594.1 GNAT family N-acetyltransferase [Photobacterium sp. 2_MG-2023]